MSETNSQAGNHNISLWSPVIDWKTRDDGSILIWRDDELGPYPEKINEKFIHWAEVAPSRTWMAQRDETGSWREETYEGGLKKIRHIAQHLLNLGLSLERPLVILTENSIEHALMALGAQHVGIPSAALAPAYATLSTDYGKLSDIARQITPGAVFVEDGEALRHAVDMAFGPDMTMIAVKNLPLDRSGHTLSFADLLKTQPTTQVDDAFARVGPDTIAKFLFTSGTTGSPKAVIQTQRMLCSNQEMIADCYAFLREKPPVVVDWAPWNHTASGNKVFNIAIFHGGTYYIDNGKPSPALFGETIRNLREISPSWYFNVPVGYEMLVRAMQADEDLKASFFKELQMMMYAGAGVAQHTWDTLTELCIEARGFCVPFGTGLGSTETAPFSLYCTDPQEQPGNIGIPAQGITVKLVPHDDKYEIRLKGPNITPGYWRNPELTAEAFDEEGYYKLGDAVRFAEAGKPEKGFYFAGRTAENFKLNTGTWVAVGPLRAKIVDEFEGLIRDAVITGEDRGALGALAVPALPVMRKALGPDSQSMSDEAVLADPRIAALLAEKLAAHQKASTGSATRVMRMLLLTEPLRFDKGEVTDKGSVNQRAVLRERNDLVELLYQGAPAVITAKKGVAA